MSRDLHFITFSCIVAHRWIGSEFDENHSHVDIATTSQNTVMPVTDTLVNVALGFLPIFQS